MSWASRRRTLYLLGVLLFFVVTVGVPAYFRFHQAPNCFDGKQNADETDVDRGGSCQALNPRALIPLSVQWTRSFPTQSGVYNAVAIVQNPNDGAGAIDVPYRFKLYDADNALIAVRQGTTFIMPGSITPVFEGRIETRGHEVVRTFFEFTDLPAYQRMTDRAREIAIGDKTSLDTTTMPRVTATAEDKSVQSLLDLEFVAVVFDTAGNAFAASQTALDRLDPRAPRNLSFTWNSAWKYAVGRIDILPLILPVAAK